MEKNNKQPKSRSFVGRLFFGFLVLLALVIGASFLPDSVVPEKLKSGHQLLVKARERVTVKVKEETGPDSPSFSSNRHLTICSFHIPSLGVTRSKFNTALAYVLKNYDIIVIQGLVAPPFPMNFPDGRSVTPTDAAQDFFNALLTYGFEYELSPEDTGPGVRIHKNNASTEWWVVFYKDKKVKVEGSLPNGYLAGDRSNHKDYERVPYAFAFRTVDGNLDFVLISVHLDARNSDRGRSKRKQELESIKSWIESNNKIESDFIILGNMNLENADEFIEVVPFGYTSLNDKCRATTTNISSPKPSSHVMYNPLQTIEIDEEFGMEIVDLKKALKELWRKDDPYPGAPYDHEKFAKFYSIYQPVVFRLQISANDDD